MKIKAVAIYPDRTPEVVVVDNHRLADYYAVTGGYIEPVVHWDTNTTMYCNEDGLMLRLPPNGLATQLFVEAGANIGGGVVLGNVLVVGPTDEDGNDTDVTDAFLSRVGITP